MLDIPEIEGYKFVKELGQGGMADVYLMLQENLDRLVAVKVLIPESFRDKHFLKRFIREARTLSKLIHPHIVTIHDVGKTEKSYYIIMEYLQESLKDRIRKKKMKPDDALHIVNQIGSALFFAHKKGVVHRDIKPDNIMFRMDGTPVLLDFGIARARDEVSTKLTKTGVSIGTPNYISPEQAKGEKVDGRSDIYSLGVVLYEMLTGAPPLRFRQSGGIGGKAHSGTGSHPSQTA